MGPCREEDVEQRWHLGGGSIAVILQELMRPTIKLALHPAECSRARQGGGHFRLPRISAMGLNGGSFPHLGFNLGRQSNCFSDFYWFTTLEVSVQEGWLTWSVLVM